MGMGGAHIALKPDSTMPLFVNPGNPASYALIRLASLEVGGRYQYTDYKTPGSGLYKWTTNFTYATLGFPVGRRGGACIGMMPYSSVGYNTEGVLSAPSGELRQIFGGSGGTNKAFFGYGIMPFSRSALKFRYRNFSRPDSLPQRSHRSLMTGYFLSKMLSELSAGFNAEYLFGNMLHSSRIVYPGSQLYNNTYLERSVTLGDFTGNFGVQTAITIDSVRNGARRRALSEKSRFTFGFFMGLGNELKALANSVAYNYVTTGTGQELVRDTVTFEIEQPSVIRLPLEQGIGIGYKKGERWNVVADLAVTRWSGFSAPFDAVRLTDNYRAGIGAAFVPEKFAAGRGAFWRRNHYRFGASYETGYARVGGKDARTYYISAGIGLPVGIGRISSMVNLSLQAGQTGSATNGLRENFFRVHMGFTFCDRWFQKFRYD